MAGAGFDRTLRIIRAKEGFVSGVYHDIVGYATIGYGHLITKKDKDLIGRELSVEEGEALLRKDIATNANPALNALKVPVTENQRSAISSLAFNTGPGAARKIVDLLNQGKTQEAADKFLEYDKAGKGPAKHTVKELSDRRKFERGLFLTKDEEAFDEGGKPQMIATRRMSPPSGSFTASPDAIKGNNEMILAAMRDLSRKLGAAPEENEYLEGLRREGRGPVS